MDKSSNYLLSAIPRNAYRLIAPNLSPVELKFGQILFERGRAMHEVYFPGACLVSLLTPVPGRAAIEVGMVGREGMLGFPLALGVDTSGVRALVQGGGPALHMERAAFVAALEEIPALRQSVLGYVHTLMAQITQTAICNRFHLVDGRLARWFLMTRDRIQAGEFRLTHELLGNLLGVRREGVSEAAAEFQNKHLIEYTRGSIRILDHAGLEAAACPCYLSQPGGFGGVPAWRPAPGAAKGLTPRVGQAADVSITGSSSLSDLGRRKRKSVPARSVFAEFKGP